jgi:hypothetical protein
MSVRISEAVEDPFELARESLDRGTRRAREPDA